MPLDADPFAPDAQEALRAAGRAAALSVDLSGLEAGALLGRVRRHPLAGRLALVSSFGADSVALLHLAATHAPDLPILFLETGMHFPETLAHQRQVADALGLRDVRVIRPDPGEAAAEDPDGTLHAAAPDACCTLRKVRPLARALAGFDGWITGRKRFQSSHRAGLSLVEADGPRVKLNPLAAWAPADIAAYLDRHALPRHPLVARGYPSIGCAPCTARPAGGADARAGRWAGQDKDECGIHIEAGRLVRSGEARA